MNDQLREALDKYPLDWGRPPKPGEHRVVSTTLGDSYLIVDAARELLTIREAGALIIVPDERTAVVIGDVFSRAIVRGEHSMMQIGLEVLDALRDAKPDGGSQ